MLAVTNPVQNFYGGHIAQLEKEMQIRGIPTDDVAIYSLLFTDDQVIMAGR